MNELVTASAPLVSLDHVSHSFDDARIVALKEVSLAHAEGDGRHVGASGSGESTLILLLCGIRLP